MQASRARAGVSLPSNRFTTSLIAAVVTKQLCCPLAAPPQSISAFFCGRHILLPFAFPSLPHSLHQDIGEDADLCRTVQASVVYSSASGFCIASAECQAA